MFFLFCFFLTTSNSNVYQIKYKCRHLIRILQSSLQHRWTHRVEMSCLTSWGSLFMSWSFLRLNLGISEPWKQSETSTGAALNSLRLNKLMLVLIRICKPDFIVNIMVEIYFILHLFPSSWSLISSCLSWSNFLVSENNISLNKPSRGLYCEHFDKKIYK